MKEIIRSPEITKNQKSVPLWVFISVCIFTACIIFATAFLWNAFSAKKAALVAVEKEIEKYERYERAANEVLTELDRLLIEEKATDIYIEER